MPLTKAASVEPGASLLQNLCVWVACISTSEVTEYKVKKLVPHDHICFSDLFLGKMIHKVHCSLLSLEFEYRGKASFLPPLVFN